MRLEFTIPKLRWRVVFRMHLTEKPKPPEPEKPKQPFGYIQGH